MASLCSAGATVVSSVLKINTAPWSCTAEKVTILVPGMLNVHKVAGTGGKWSSDTSLNLCWAFVMKPRHGSAGALGHNKPVLQRDAVAGHA